MEIPEGLVFPPQNLKSAVPTPNTREDTVFRGFAGSTNWEFCWYFEVLLSSTLGDQILVVRPFHIRVHGRKRGEEKKRRGGERERRGEEKKRGGGGEKEGEEELPSSRIH